MKLTLLGTGAPTPSLKRAGSGYLIQIGDDVIVMEHGPGAHHRLLQTGKRAVDVTNIFFSHARLFLTRWMQSAQFSEYMSREEVRWAEIVRRSGARLD